MLNGHNEWLILRKRINFIETSVAVLVSEKKKHAIKQIFMLFLHSFGNVKRLQYK